MDTVNHQLLSKNERLNSDLAIRTTVCGNLKKKKGQKSGNSDIEGWAVQCHNCIELSGIPDTINVNKLGEIIIEAYKDININISETDIEACHRLHLRCNSGNVGKTVIIKFLNRKHAESSLSKKFPLSLQIFLDSV